jgi:4-aminobutyrate aminotransferase
LGHLQEKYSEIGDVRGLGLMVGTEFRTLDRKPNKKAAKGIIQECLDEGLILLSCGTWDNTVRWIPPLMVNDEQIQQGLDIFEKALEKTQS